MTDVFARIAIASKTLNEQADEASRYIDEIDKRLADAGIGVHVQGPDLECETANVMTDPGELEYVAREGHVTLCYGRIGSTWGLMLQAWYRDAEQCDAEEPGWGAVTVGEEVLLRSANRESRIRAIPHIPALLEAIASQLEQRANAVAATLNKTPRTIPSPKAPRSGELISIFKPRTDS